MKISAKCYAVAYLQICLLAVCITLLSRLQKFARWYYRCGHDGVCATSQLCGRRAITHVCRQSNVLICTSDSSLTTTYHTVDTRSLSPKFPLQPWYAPQTNARLARCFVNAASHECRPFWMTSQWSALTNQRPLFHTPYFCYTIEKFHGTFHTSMNSYVEDFKSFTEHFIRAWIHTSKIFIPASKQTRLKQYVYVKIPWMILHNDTRI